MVPYEAMQQAGRFYLRRMQKSTGIPARDIVTTAVQAMGLKDVAEFDIDKKVIGMPVSEGPLANLTITVLLMKSRVIHRHRVVVRLQHWQARWALPWLQWWSTFRSAKVSLIHNMMNFVDWPRKHRRSRMNLSGH